MADLKSTTWFKHTFAFFKQGIPLVNMNVEVYEMETKTKITYFVLRYTKPHTFNMSKGQ